MTPLLTGVFASQISGHLTPAFADNGVMEPIAMVKVGSTAASNITFSNIPDTYKHLQIRGIARDTWTASGYGEFYIFPNNDTSNAYSSHGLYGAGSGVATYGYGSRTDGMFLGSMVRNGSAASTYGAFVVDILDYASTTKYKTAKALAGSELNGSGSILLQSGLWRSYNKITSLVITPNGTAFNEGTHFALYGIKGE